MKQKSALTLLTNTEFKAPWNEIRNMPRVFTSEDKTVQTPNSDTPYWPKQEALSGAWKQPSLQLVP